MRLGDGGFISTGKYLPKWTLPNTQWWISLPFKPEPLQSCCYQSFSRNWTLPKKNTMALYFYLFVDRKLKLCNQPIQLPKSTWQKMFTLNSSPIWVQFSSRHIFSWHNRRHGGAGEVQLQLQDQRHHRPQRRGRHPGLQHHHELLHWWEGKVIFLLRIMTVWHFIPVLQGSKKNNNMRISQLRKVIFLQLRYFPSIHDTLVCSIIKFQ